MNRSTKLLLAVLIAAVAIWLTASAKEALGPFVFAAVIAYVMAPLAEKLETYKIPPLLAVTIIIVLLLILLVLLPLALIPLILAQVRDFAELLPTLIEKIHLLLGSNLATWAQEQDFPEIGGSSLRQAADVISNIFSGGVSLLSGIFTSLLIVPLATFYFLRDRKSISGELTEILPPRIRNQAIIFSRDLDSVLGEFLRGQLLVMLIMAVFYSVVLKLAGLPFALTIGILSGLLTFIPYVGFIFGVLLASLVGIGNFESFIDIAIIWLLMGIGTVLESVIITPRLVGERVGLHPLAVLLALTVMAEFFGFVGVLVALPTAAILLVCGRHLRRRYIGSGFYGSQ